jgi:hypothetical protein
MVAANKEATEPGVSSELPRICSLCCKYDKYMFNLIDNYSFISVNGCVGSGPSALLFPGAYYDVNR